MEDNISNNLGEEQFSHLVDADLAEFLRETEMLFASRGYKLKGMEIEPPADPLPPWSCAGHWEFRRINDKWQLICVPHSVPKPGNPAQIEIGEQL